MGVIEDRFRGFSPASARAVEAARKYLDKLIAAGILGDKDRSQARQLSKELGCLPLGTVAGDRTVVAVAPDQHNMSAKNWQDTVIVGITLSQATLSFEIAGNYLGDNYFTQLFCVEIGSYKAQGRFSDLVAWENVAAQVTSSKQVTGSVEIRS
jgi:hypothetical protein